jgi:hypothetical protein
MTGLTRIIDDVHELASNTALMIRKSEMKLKLGSGNTKMNTNAWESVIDNIIKSLDSQMVTLGKTLTDLKELQESASSIQGKI